MYNIKRIGGKIMAKKKEEKELETKKENKENKSRHEVEVVIDGTTWEKALDKAFTKKQKEVNVDGFRKGHVPRDIYEKKFGKESLFMDAADDVLQDAYTKALEQSKFVPVAQPQVRLKEIDEQKVVFVFTFITAPEVKIKKYTGLNIKKDEVKVTEEEINHEMGHLLEKYTELVVKEDAISEGDVAIIDFEGFLNGEAFEGGKGEAYSLEIGSHTFIPGFEEQLIGMKAGEEKDIQVTFPEDYPQEDLKGKEVTFKVKVNEVKMKEKRELDEEFFEDLGMEGVNDEASLRSEIEAHIKAQKEMDAENTYIDQLLEAVAKQVTCDVPEEMVEEEIDRLMGRFAQQMQMQGLSLDVYYQFTRTTEQDLRNQMEKEAYKNVLYRLMLEEIAKLENIKVSVEDADKEAQNLADKYQMEKDAFLKSFGGIEMIQYDLEMRKTIDFLKEKNA